MKISCKKTNVMKLASPVLLQSLGYFTHGALAPIKLLNKFSIKCYKNSSCLRTFNADYQPISPLNRQETSSIPARLLNKPSVEINSIKLLSNLEAKTGCSRSRMCASSYKKHSNHRSNAHTQTFTASTQRGAVHKISSDNGLNQIAETNAQPLELLSAVVRDANDNLLPNIPVVFTIEAGDASFADITGIQATAYTTGPNPAKATQDGPALFSGQIFDDKSQPLAGVKVSISRTNLVATSNAQGKFELNNIPPRPY